MSKISIVKYGHQDYNVEEMYGHRLIISKNFTGKTARAKAMTMFKKLSIRSEEHPYKKEHKRET